jgi:PII-like signaling protein
MNALEEAEVLRLYIGESDKQGHRPLYEAIVEEARKAGLAGATVFRGVLGYGEHSLIHTTNVLRISEDLPMVVEIVDTPAKVSAFLPIVEGMLGDGLITRSRVEAIRIKKSP